jgi:NitT/TauT family transport system substrate-binding protein
MTRPRSHLAWRAGLVVLALVAGCADNPTPQGGGGLEKKTITVASLPLLDAAGLHIALRRKLFEAEGLEVKVQPVAQSIAALPALKNGQVDVIAGANYVTFLQASEQGALKVKVLADAASEASRFMRVLVPSDSPIRTPKDLAGRTVAVNILNNIQSLTLNEILRANQVDPATVTYRAVPFPLMDKALQNHDVDAVHTGEPFGTLIQGRQGARMVVDGGAAPVTDLPVSGYVSTDDFVTRYPRTAAAFQRAIGKAQALAAGDRAEVESVIVSYAKVDARTAGTVTLPGFPTSTDPARLQRLSDLMGRNGLLKAPLDVRTVLATPPPR